MSPPRLAAALLSRALRNHPAGPTILGDFHQEFVLRAREGCEGPARRWYWREAVLFSFGRCVHELRPNRWIKRVMKAPDPLHSTLQDLVYAWRSVLRAPGFSLFAALLLGLGVGGSVAVFSVVKPLILAPLPFPESENLVWVANVPEAGETSLSDVTSRSGNLRDFRERSRSFDGLTGYNAFFDMFSYTLTGVGDPEKLVGVGVAHDFLEVLRVEPLHGRSFTAEEGFQGRAAILSYGYWRRRFDQDPSVVGRTLTINEESYDVVGVLPRSFDFSSLFTPGLNVDFLLPFPVDSQTDRLGNAMVILGRLRQGVTPEQAQADLDGIIAGLLEEQPGRWGLGARITPLQEKIAGPFMPTLLLLLAAAATLLLIVCVNLSSLILARSPGRAREVAIRRAFGASQGRLARQLVLEMSGIALVGAGMGSGLAWACTRFIRGTQAVKVPLLNEVGLDGTALLLAAGVALLTGISVSIVPALRVREGQDSKVLGSESRGSTTNRRGRRLRESLVVAEVALACVLLVVGGLLVRSFRAVLDVDLGFVPENTVAWRLDLNRELSQGADPLPELGITLEGLVRRVEQTPGIERAGVIDALPLGRNRSWSFRVVGRPDEEGLPDLFPHLIYPGYLEAMRIPLLSGRSLSRDDAADAPLAILINESGARQVFLGEDPLGKRISMWRNLEWEIVGVVKDVRHLSPEMDHGIQVYFSLLQMPDFTTLDLVVRSGLPAEQVVTVVSPILREIAPNAPTGEFWTLQSSVDEVVSARSFTLWILAAYGVAALVLAALGIYGVLAQSVAERRQEIGIRMALGASWWEMVRSVLGRTLALAGVGIAIGGLVSLWAGDLLESLLFGVGATDPATYLGMLLILLAIATLAGLVPAVRAARIRGASVLDAL